MSDEDLRALERQADAAPSAAGLRLLAEALLRDGRPLDAARRLDLALELAGDEEYLDLLKLQDAAWVAALEGLEPVITIRPPPRAREGRDLELVMGGCEPWIVFYADGDDEIHVASAITGALVAASVPVGFRFPIWSTNPVTFSDTALFLLRGDPNRHADATVERIELPGGRRDVAPVGQLAFGAEVWPNQIAAPPDGTRVVIGTRVFRFPSLEPVTTRPLSVAKFDPFGCVPVDALVDWLRGTAIVRSGGDCDLVGLDTGEVLRCGIEGATWFALRGTRLFGRLHEKTHSFNGVGVLDLVRGLLHEIPQIPVAAETSVRGLALSPEGRRVRVTTSSFRERIVLSHAGEPIAHDRGRTVPASGPSGQTGSWHPRADVLALRQSVVAFDGRVLATAPAQSSFLAWTPDGSGLVAQREGALEIWRGRGAKGQRASR